VKLEREFGESTENEVWKWGRSGSLILSVVHRMSFSSALELYGLFLFLFLLFFFVFSGKKII